MGDLIERIRSDLERVRCRRMDIISVGEPESKADGSVLVQARMKVSVVNRSELHPLEPVDLKFFSDYPERAPIAILRNDFSTHFPHLNPNAENLALPCIYEGDMDELVALSGLEEYFEYLATWLHRAARNDLINPEQGWEPIRYDMDCPTLVLDTENYASCLRCDVMHGKMVGKTYLDQIDVYQARLDLIRIIANPILIQQDKGEIPCIYFRVSNKIQDQYKPNLAIDEVSLGAYIRELSGSSLYERFLKGLPKGGSYAVILPIQRPYHLIGTESNIEYIARLVQPGMSVQPLRVRSLVHANTLQRLNGVEWNDKSVALIGCGSLGSKVGSHLARMGIKNLDVYDKDVFEPHNFARNALCFSGSDSIGVPKACLFKHTHEIADSKINAIYSDFVTDHSLHKKMATASEIIETTGSVRVLRALSNSSHTQPSISAFMLNNGKYGVILCEGAGRSPMLDELDAYLCDMAIDNQDLSEALTANQGKIPVGLGCRSVTAVISDPNISLTAAGVVNYLKKRLEGNTPSNGEIWLGKIHENRMGMQWESYPCLTFVDIQVSGNARYRVRISTSIVAEMERLASLEHPNETGGLLYGEYRANDSQVIITRIASAPKVQSSPSEFVILPDGVAEQADNIAKATTNRIQLLGTWHSHPRGGEASATDQMALRLLTEILKPTPALVAIWDFKAKTCGILVNF